MHIDSPLTKLYKEIYDNESIKILGLYNVMFHDFNVKNNAIQELIVCHLDDNTDYTEGGSVIDLSGMSNLCKLYMEGINAEKITASDNNTELNKIYLIGCDYLPLREVILPKLNNIKYMRYDYYKGSDGVYGKEYYFDHKYKVYKKIKKKWDEKTGVIKIEPGERENISVEIG